MQFHNGGTKRALRAARKPLLAAVIAGAAMSSALLATAAPALAVNTPPPGGLTFYSNFSNGIQPWTTGGGGAQCSNYGTPSTAPRLRGTFSVSSSGPAGEPAGVFTLPANSSSTYSKEACELVPKAGPLGLGTDEYYGYMFDVPMGFSIGTNSFWGIATAQYHFQNIWGAPITFELHNDHMTLALETGSCINYTSPDAGCQYRSNADNPGGNPGNLGAQYVVPPGSMQQGAWHEVIMHVHWAPNNTGQIQVWHRVQGASSWTQTVNLTGLPTVQYDAARGCCTNAMVDKVGAYRASSTTPVSVAEANIMTGSSFNNVAANLP